MSLQKKYLNCGCGTRFYPEWENIDFVSHSPYVKQCDLTKGIPYADNFFDVVYHSHVLEHFSKQQAIIFIQECYRVLKTDGIIRIAVPDLESLARCYLENLDKARHKPSELNDANYQWSVIELLDQMVRDRSGGEMLKFWDRDHIINESYIADRLGYEFTSYRNFRASIYKGAKENSKDNAKVKTNILSSIRSRLKNYLLKSYLPAIESGNFRRSGEIHKWMYDTYSLSSVLKQTGFSQIVVRDAFTSNIPGWEEYKFLDVENGCPRKPDSLFVEAVK